MVGLMNRLINELTSSRYALYGQSSMNIFQPRNVVLLEFRRIALPVVVASLGMCSAYTFAVIAVCSHEC